MDTIKQQIVTNYWLNKISNTIDEIPSVSAEKGIAEENISYEDITYFSKLTNNSEMVEYTVLFSIFNALLCRYFDNKSLIYSQKVGSDAIQLLFQSIPIQKATLKTLLQETKEEVQEVYKNALYNQEKLSNKFPFTAYANYGILYKSEPVAEAATIPFVLSIQKIDSGFSLKILHDTSFVDTSIANHFLSNFKSWIIQLQNYLSEALEKISIVSEAEQQKLFTEYNNTSVNYPKYKTLVDLVEEQVAKTPDSIALLAKNNSFSYQEINEKANRLAHFIREKYKVVANDLIAIKLERNENLLIAILAVLKSGAAYVPVDVKYPKQRIAYIEKDSNAKVIIDKEFINKFHAIEKNYSTENVSVSRSDESLAYVIYTSGTTGNPKGVMISHKNAVAFIHWAQQEFDIEKIDVVYAATSHCFDLSVFEMFFSLAAGRKIRMLTDILEATDTLITDTNILLNTVPSAIRNIIEQECSLENVSIINLAGEPFPVDIGNKLLKTNAEIRNLYGPSEDTTYSTIYQLNAEKEYIKSIPIGVPISNTRAYILDDNLQLLPIGVPGKLYLSGDGIAKGYLNREELTNEKFVENPFEKGERMYDTGDIAKWSVDKNIEYLGRNDHQVKLRGYRIELGEIENAITSYSDNIGQAVAMVKNQVLLAYYTVKNTIDLDMLKTYLQDQLPNYMIPTRFIVLATIPLTPNGKVDRKALEKSNLNNQLSEDYVAPRNKKEEKLAQIWKEVLGVEKVGIRDNFFELGGHSLMIGKVINKIYKELNGSIHYKEFFRYPIIEEMCKHLKDDSYVPIAKTEKQTFYPLTPSQNRFWIMSHLSDAKEAYVISGAVKITGTIDDALFTKAFQHVVQQHESLRTVFKKNDDGDISQHITDDYTLSDYVAIVDISTQKLTEKAIAAYINSLQTHEFDLSKTPLCKVTLVKTGVNEAIFHIHLHHIIADGYSLEILTNEVLKNYELLLSGVSELQIDTEAIQYSDYTLWLESQQNTTAFQESRDYWLNEFSEEIPTLTIPGYQKRPVIKSYAGNSMWYHYSSETLKKLETFSKSHKVTLYSVLSSLVNIILARYSSQEEIITGIPVAGREHPDLEGQIGLYINTVALKSSISQNDTFATIVKNTSEKINTALAHQSYPFNQLIEELNLERNLSRSPLFDVMVVLQNQMQSIKEEEKNIVFESYELERTTCQYDLVFSFVKASETDLALELQYNTDIYTEKFISKMIGHMEIALETLLSHSESAVETINIVSDAEKNEILLNFNNTSVSVDRSLTVIDAFKTQAEKYSEQIAVQTENASVTYKKLHEKSNAFGHYLKQEYGIREGDLIVVKLNRSAQMITAQLGILKIGAAFVPVDTQYPENRIQYIIEDTNAVLVVDVDVIDKFNKFDNRKTTNHNFIYNHDSLAYIIYTSGSTGKPKGVMITHNNLMNLCQWHIRYYGVTEKSKGTLYAGTGFDASLWEIYPYIISGAALYPIQEQETRLHIPSLVSFLQLNEITHAYVPSKICQEILANKEFNVSAKLLTGGEAFTYNPTTNVEVYNNYGPTENTVVTTVYKCNNATTPNVPIGKPIDNTQVYILSSGLQIQPIGVVGELYISGDSLAKGYLNLPEITTENFIAHPFKKDEKLYKTGDRVSWLPDGNIVFHGRVDHQVKIRGYRVELDEIIHCINAFSEGISQATVVLQSKNGIDNLIAYYTASSEIDKKKLSNHLKSQLPNYMVPKIFMQIPEIPLTANGKVNYKRLPEVSNDDMVTKSYEPPTSITEKKMVKIWEELLKIDTISIADDFFELGGHSLLITKLLNAYQQTFGKSVNLKDLFNKTTIKSQAEIIDSASIHNNKIEKVTVQQHYEISPSQMRYWLIHKLQGGSREFNIYSAFELPKETNIEIFTLAFQDLLRRHEALRTVFVEDKGMPRQYIHEVQPIEIPLYTTYEEAKTYVFEHIFDLENYPLFRVALYKNMAETSLFFNLHHSIGDGWTMHILQRDLLELYRARLHNEIHDLPELSIQYKDYSTWQNQQISSESYKELSAYWKKQFAGTLTYLELPADFPVSNAKEKTAASYTVFLPENLKVEIESLARKSATSVFGVLMASLNILLNRLTSESDIIVGIPVANRNHHQLKDVVGCFINTLMIRNEFDDNLTAKEFISQVGDTLKDALKYQNYPFEQLLEDVQVSVSENRFPLSPVFLNMIDFENTQEATISNFETIHTETDAIPKFDIEYYGKTYANGIELKCIYNDKIFTKETIALWTNELVNLIQQLAAENTKQLKSYSLFNQKAVHEIELRPANKFIPFEAEEIAQTIAERFEKQVAKSPNAIAVTAENKSLTYQQLNGLANYTAAQIIAHKQTNALERVALIVPHNQYSAVAMLGTLKAGCAYVPIDSETPIERITYILQDAACRQLVCVEETKSLAEKISNEVANLVVHELSLTQSIQENPSLPTAPDDEAYVLYTSGSTGVPKGVIQNNRNVLHYIRIYTNNVRISAQDNLSVFSSYTFDASVKDIYGAILNGAHVSFYNLLKDGIHELSDWIHKHQITIIHMVPTLYRAFLKTAANSEKLQSVRIIDLGGEACYKLDFELFVKNFSKEAFLINDYGPTEATIVTQKFYHHDSTVIGNNLSIGKSVEHTAVFIRNSKGEKANIYEEGEIVFKSAFLSLGYLNKEAQTQKVFKKVPNSATERYYASGDLGKTMPNGEIIFLKRKDQQTKINGFRIELAEIEYHLLQIAAVAKAVVMVKEVSDKKILTAYMQTNTSSPNHTEIKNILAESLPKYMIPQLFIEIDTFPLTRTGKIDRKQLPEPEISKVQTVPYEAPISEVEQTLTTIWASVLNLEAAEIGVNHNFFELGGNSLQGVLLINKINKEYNSNFSISDLYDTLTIKDLALLVTFYLSQTNSTAENHLEEDEIII